LKAYLDILKLVWPLALGMVNNAAMQFVDRAYLARASMASLEAVLPASTLAWVFLSFFQSVVGYSGVFVAQYHGAENAALCRRSCWAGMFIALLSGLLLVPCIPLGGWVFARTSASCEVGALARSYYDIVMAGGVFLLGQMAASSYFTGRGRTRLLFWINLCGNILNVALDPLLIFGYDGCVAGMPLRVPRLGIAGAAYATVIAQFVQFVVLGVALLQSVRVRAEERVCVSEPTLLRLCLRILRFGVPAGGYEILNMASFTTFVFITGRVGDLAFAVSNACFSVNYLLFAPMIGFSLGVQTLVGQARGRGDDVGAAMALRRTTDLAVVFVVACCAVTLALHRPILALFAPSEPALRDEFISLGRTLMMLMSGWVVFDAVDVVLSGALKGAGDTRFVFVWMLVTSFLLWMPMVAAALILTHSIVVLWSTMILYVLIITFGSWWRWHRGKWRSIDLVFEVKRMAD